MHETMRAANELRAAAPRRDVTKSASVFTPPGGLSALVYFASICQPLTGMPHVSLLGKAIKSAPQFFGVS
jgi:hypothetical protein